MKRLFPALTRTAPVGSEPAAMLGIEGRIAPARNHRVERGANDPSIELDEQAPADSAGERRHLDGQHAAAIKLILRALGLVGMVFVCFAIALAVLRLGVGP